jgi:hypothetical protein
MNIIHCMCEINIKLYINLFYLASHFHGKLLQTNFGNPYLFVNSWVLHLKYIIFDYLYIIYNFIINVFNVLVKYWYKTHTVHLIKNICLQWLWFRLTMWWIWCSSSFITLCPLYFDHTPFYYAHPRYILCILYNIMSILHYIMRILH